MENQLGAHRPMGPVANRFRGRHFKEVIIILCVRVVFAVLAQLPDLEEMIPERGLAVDHVTIWRWV